MSEGLPTQQRFAIEELAAEELRRERGGGVMDAARVAFFMERIAGPPVSGHALLAKGNHRLVCECGRFTVWTLWSLARGRLDVSPAVRHDAHRTESTTTS